MASAHYALGVHTAIKHPSEVHPLDLCTAYADDWDLAGTLPSVSQAFNQVLAEGPEIGATINASKSLLILLDGNDDPDLAPGVPRCLDGNFICLGSPIGDEAFCTATARKVVAEADRLLQAIETLTDLHSAFALFRYCATYPRMVHLMRTVPPPLIRAALEEFDTLIRTRFESIFNMPASDASWTEMTLAVKRGGLALRTTNNHASAAYLSSLNASFPLAAKVVTGFSASHLAAACADLNAHLQGTALVTEDTFPRNEALDQRVLSSLIEDAQLEAVTAAASPDSRSRILSLQEPCTGAWLTLPPDPAKGHWMPGREFATYLRHRYGLPVYPASTACPQCGDQQDAHGRHALKCRHSGDRIRRHNRVRNRFLALARQARLDARPEVVGLLGATRQKPADVLVANFSAGRPACLDFGVTSPHQPHLRAGLLTDPAHAVCVYEQVKARKTAELCEERGLLYVPMVVDTWGVWGPKSEPAFRLLARALSLTTGRTIKTATRTVRNDLNCVLAVANAHMLTARLSS